MPGCQKLQMIAEPGLAQDALQLYPYGNSWRQRVNETQCRGGDSCCCTRSCRGYRARKGPRGTTHEFVALEKYAKGEDGEKDLCKTRSGHS